jgi:hypothetical protein
MKGYTTKEAIENYFLIDIDESFDTQIDDWIEASENIIDQETGRDFTPADADESTERLYDGDGTDILLIGGAIGGISVKLSPDSDPLDEDQYYLYPANKPVKRSIVLKYLKFPKGMQNIVVEAAYGEASLPADIKLAATILAGAMVSASKASGEDGEVQSTSIGRYSVTYRAKSPTWQALPAGLVSVQDILDRNRRYAF